MITVNTSASVEERLLFIFCLPLSPLWNNKSINFATKIDFTSSFSTQSGVMCTNSENNSLRMVEKWLKDDNYITTPFTIAIKWIRNNQFSLSSGEFFLAAKQKMCLKLFTANAIKTRHQLFMYSSSWIYYIMYRQRFIFFPLLLDSRIRFVHENNNNEIHTQYYSQVEKKRAKQKGEEKETSEFKNKKNRFYTIW